MKEIFTGRRRWKILLGASSMGALVLHWTGLLEAVLWMGIAVAPAGCLLEVPAVNRRVSSFLSHAGRRLHTAWTTMEEEKDA
jgi:hypothetical protein